MDVNNLPTYLHSRRYVVPTLQAVLLCTMEDVSEVFQAPICLDVFPSQII